MSTATRIALVTGITGQDGPYLAELLLRQGYEVHGVAYGSAPVPLLAEQNVHDADLGEGSNLEAILNHVRPDEVYHLAALTDVRKSFDLPVPTANVTGLGTLRLLEAVRNHQIETGRTPRFCHASSSEIFGKTPLACQDENTPYHPRSPYACAKLFAHCQTVNYREAYGMFACNAILFNHESPRRPEAFVTRKITRAAARIKLGLQDRLKLGNLDAQRDWGFAGDYVAAMWRMLQHSEPDDYVIATGETHSVREFLEEAFRCVGLDWRQHVEFDTRLLRPSEVDVTCGDAGKARRILGWQPRVSFLQLTRMMVDADLALARQELRLREDSDDAASDV